jgi:hypothetical protein
MLGDPKEMLTDSRYAPIPATTARIVVRSPVGLATRRASLFVLLVVGFLSLLQATAWAQDASPSPRDTKIASQGWEEPGCGAFSLTQTYGKWGPARHYEQPVTVVYDAIRCSRERNGGIVLSIEGVAVVYRGTSADGAPLDERPFYVSGRWKGASNAEGWPPDWWQCDVDSAEYSWRIAGVYSFSVAVQDGNWALDVSMGGKSVHWTYDGCA